MNKCLITVIGPTAIGKTALAVSLAKFFDTEIISADSRQFYKEMSIGTAVPTAEEQQGIPHHFIRHISVKDAYSVGDFEAEAVNKINDLFKTHNILILVGGSGLYTDAILKGLDSFPAISEGVRAKLNQILEKKGIGELQTQLAELDPEYYQRVDLQNPHRLIRALEVSLSSGKPYSSFLGQPKANRPFTSIIVGLEADRDILYQRINARVDQMMANGLLEEVKQLLAYKEHNALQTVGYQELFAHLEGKYKLETAVEEIKKNTRRFAKRQLTWYRKTQDVLWFDYRTSHQQIAISLEHKMSDSKGAIYYVMGVSGSGKSTVGKLLAKELGFPFFDGDDYHPEANILKMSQGKPLDDDDRKPWLERLRDLSLENSQPGCVIACSALKEKYREILADKSPHDVQWIYLDGAYQTIFERMKKREGHFMPEDLLKSQFDTLEIPKEAIHIPVALPPMEQLTEILNQLKTKRKSGF